MPKVEYVASFEFHTDPPLTLRGRVEASRTRTMAARAIEDLCQHYPRRNWASLVLVLERTEES